MERSRSQHFVVSSLSVRCVDLSSVQHRRRLYFGTLCCALGEQNCVAPAPWVVIWYLKNFVLFCFDLFGTRHLLFLLIAEAPMRNTPMQLCDLTLLSYSKTMADLPTSRSVSISVFNAVVSNWMSTTFTHLITPTLFLSLKNCISYQFLIKATSYRSSLLNMLSYIMKYRTSVTAFL